MALATADADGAPDVRMVLLKDFDARGFSFYSELRQRQGSADRSQPACGLVLLLEEPQAPGAGARGDRAACRTTRPTPISKPATAAPASAPGPARNRAPCRIGLALEKRVAEFALKFGVGEVPRPDHWGGFRLAPLEFEFWRDRPFRLHDRLVFKRDAPGQAWRKAACSLKSLNRLFTAIAQT